MRKLITLITVMCAALITFGVTNTSTGTSWNNTGHWSQNHIPTASEDVVINTDMTMNASTNAVAKSVTINSTKSLTVNSTSELVFTTDFANNGTFTCAGDLKWTGTATTGVEINGNDFSVGTFTINGSGTLEIHNKLSVEGCLYLQNGTIETNCGSCDELIFDENTAGTKKGRICEATGGKINGEYTANFLIYINAASGSANWAFVGSPKDGTELSDWNIYTTGFTGANAPNWPSSSNPWPSVYTYDNSVIGSGGLKNDGWVSATNITNTTDNMEGIIIYESTVSGNGPKLQTLAGNIPHDQSEFFTLALNSSAAAGEGGWNFLANPFAGTYDLMFLGTTISNTNGCNCNATVGNQSLYIYNTNNSVGNYYDDWSYRFNVGTTDRYLAEGQSFWIDVTSGSQAGSFEMPEGGMSTQHKYIEDKKSTTLEYIEVQYYDQSTVLYFVDDQYNPTLHPDQNNDGYDVPKNFYGSDAEAICFGYINGTDVADDHGVKTSTIDGQWQTAYVEVREELNPDEEDITIINHFTCDGGHDEDCNEIQVWDEQEQSWKTVGNNSSKSVTQQYWITNGQVDDAGMKTVLKIRFRVK